MCVSADSELQRLGEVSFLVPGTMQPRFDCFDRAPIDGLTQFREALDKCRGVIMNHKSIVTLCFAAALALASGAAQAQGTTPSQGTQAAQGKSTADEKFVINAIQGDMVEIEMGKLAQQKGENPKVKQFGEKLVTDHSANLDKAKSLAQSLNVTPPSELSAKQKAAYEKMSKLSGSKFDRQFARHMVADHREDIRAFQKESKKSGAAADFAKQTLPTLNEHLQIARSLAKTKKTSTTTGSSTNK